LRRIVVYLFISLLILQVYSGLGLAIAKNVSGLGAIKEQSQLKLTSVAQTGALIQSQNVVANVVSTPTSLANNTDSTNYIGPAGIETPLEPPAEPDGKAQETLAQPCGALIQQSSNNTSPPVATNSCKAEALIDSHQSDPISGISDSPAFSYDLQEPTGVTPTGTSTALVNAASTGSLTIYVKNVNGAYIAGVRVVLYDVNYNPVGQKYTNSYGYVYWASLNYGTYFDEAYYPSSASLHFEEFWGGDQINVAASSTTSYFTRHTQYVYQIKANGQVIPGTDVEVNPGDNVHVDVTVANKESVAKNVMVTLYLDRDKSSPYDLPPTQHGPVTIPNNGNGGFGWDYSTNNYGSYWAYIVVYGYYNGKYIVTDQYDWLVAFYVRYPDLMWTNIWTNPSSRTGGQSATIYCELKNQGTGNTPITFTNYFYIDGAYDSYGVNNGLAAGAAFDWTFTRTLGPGYHTITASADVYNNVPEANEGNNQLSQKLWWSAPDLIVSNIWWVDSYGNQNPTITSGQNFTLYFAIKNIGDAPANGAFYTYLTVSNGQWASYGPQNGLAVGGTVNYYLSDVMVSSSTPSTATVTVTVDYNNNIAEANQNAGSGTGTGETNNIGTVSIPIQQALWTIISYESSGSSGQYDLSASIDRNIAAMESAGSSPQVSIICLADKSQNHDTRAYFIKPNLLLQMSYPGWQDELDMADEDTLVNFVTYAINRFRANHYVLILDSHGDGLGGLMEDDGYPNGPDTMSVIDLGAALTIIANACYVQNTHLSKLDIVGLDACLMGTTEVAYQFRDSASVFIGSEKDEWFPGPPLSPDCTWRYGDFLSYLRNNPLISNAALATKIVDSYVDHWVTIGWFSITLAAINLTTMQTLVNKISNLGDVLWQNYHSLSPQIRAARAETEQYDDRWMIDLYHFSERIYADVSDPTVRQACLDVQNALTSMVIRERHFTGTSDIPADHAHGLTVWFPTANNEYDMYINMYKQLDFGMAETDHWNKLLYYYIFNPNAPPLVQIASPNSHSMWSKTQTITWAGLDADYDSVTYTISFSANGGSTWQTLFSVSYKETPAWATHTASFDTTISSDSKNCLISVLFDDGRYQSTVGSGTFTIDNTPPTVGIVHFSGSPTISLIANDATSGVYAIYYRIDGGTWNTYSAPFSIPTGAAHLIESYSTDNAGNTGPTVHLTVYYLTTSTNYGSVSPTSGWYDSGSIFTISSTAASGYVWNGWSGSGPGSYTGTNNPATITMNGAISETAAWTPPPPPGKIAGVVTDTASVGVSGATVSYSGSVSGSVSTDSSGNYFTPDLPPGSYTVTVSKNGYVSQTKSATVVSDSTTTVDFQLQPNPPSTTGSFDFGTGSSPVESGYTQVTESTVYSAALGYGWDSAVGLGSRDRGAPDNLRRDLVFSSGDHTFKVDLANGQYTVTLIIGDNGYTHDLIDVYAENVLQVDHLTVNAGAFSTQVFTVLVNDGQLSIKFHDAGGSDLNWVINAIKIEPVI
jgi:hypothetical protein